MNKTLINDPFRNPFHNRFHVPVQSRLDEMQSHAQWLHDPTPAVGPQDRHRQTRIWLRALAGAFALVLVVVFSAVLSAFLFN